MSSTAALYSSLVDQLTAALNGGGIGSGSVVPTQLYQATVPTASPQLPCIVVRLPTQPYDTTDWAASGNKKEGAFKVEIGVLAQVTTDGSVTHPYGDATNPGILTLADDVQNVLETSAAVTAFRAASTAYVDHKATTEVFQKEDAATASATITITFKTRYTAGLK